MDCLRFERAAPRLYDRINRARLKAYDAGVHRFIKEFGDTPRTEKEIAGIALKLKLITQQEDVSSMIITPLIEYPLGIGRLHWLSRYKVMTLEKTHEDNQTKYRLVLANLGVGS